MERVFSGLSPAPGSVTKESFLRSLGVNLGGDGSRPEWAALRGIRGSDDHGMIKLGEPGDLYFDTKQRAIVDLWDFDVPYPDFEHDEILKHGVSDVLAGWEPSFETAKVIARRCDAGVVWHKANLDTGTGSEIMLNDPSIHTPTGMIMSAFGVFKMMEQMVSGFLEADDMVMLDLYVHKYFSSRGRTPRTTFPCVVGKFWCSCMNSINFFIFSFLYTSIHGAGSVSDTDKFVSSLNVVLFLHDNREFTRYLSLVCELFEKELGSNWIDVISWEHLESLNNHIPDNKPRNLFLWNMIKGYTLKGIFRKDLFKRARDTLSGIFESWETYACPAIFASLYSSYRIETLRGRFVATTRLNFSNSALSRKTVITRYGRAMSNMLMMCTNGETDPDLIRGAQNSLFTVFFGTVDTDLYVYHPDLYRAYTKIDLNAEFGALSTFQKGKRKRDFSLQQALMVSLVHAYRMPSLSFWDLSNPDEKVQPKPKNPQVEPRFASVDAIFTRI